MDVVSRTLVVLCLMWGIVVTNAEYIDEEENAVESGAIATHSRSLANFALLVTCHQKNLSGLKFNDYGCWCGSGGKGTPVDKIDECCKVHDKCYSDAKKKGCKYWNLGHPKIVFYRHTCNKCLNGSKSCAGRACRCDLTAAKCFAKYKYNKSFKNYPSSKC